MSVTTRMGSIVRAMLVAALLGAAVLVAVVVPAPSAAAATPGHHGRIVLRAGGPAATVAFRVHRGGEALLDLVVAAPGADWGRSGAEAAVVGVSVDDRYATDIVIPSDHGIARQFGLGELRPGRHVLRLRFATDRSAPAVRSALLRHLRVTTVTGRSTDAALAARYAPVLYGRNLPAYGGPLSNATSDTPLVAWHHITAAPAAGHRIVEVSYVWSNEDGGTDTPRLMARWGRTTDIEWIYRVEVDARGERVPGSDTFQAPAHTTTTFRGRYEGTHAVLSTCTENNNVCDTVDDPMRFALSAQQSVPDGLPREAIMDANPWTYQVMAAEMRREGKIEAVASPRTPQLSDQRNYLFLAFDKDTLPTANSGSNWIGVGIGVTLRGSSTVYRSDHLGTGGDTDWSVQRDDPAATTVELPAGTTAADVSGVVAYRVVHGSTDPGNAVRVTSLIRGFFLGDDYTPQRSFLSWTGAVTLTADAPSALIWTGGRTT